MNPTFEPPSNTEVLQKMVQYYYDDNGNQLSQTTGFVHKHTVKLRQSTRGTISADNMQEEVDPLIERVNNTFERCKGTVLLHLLNPQ